jgi:hypothetical protein
LKEVCNKGLSEQKIVQDIEEPEGNHHETEKEKDIEEEVPVLGMSHLMG